MKVEDWLGADNQLGIDIWNKKYRYGEESFDEWLDRVSGGDENVRRLIVEKKFLFGGRILANRGLDKLGKKVTLSNCFSGDTVIRTRNGLVKMEDVVGQDIEVFSYGTWRKATVKSFGNQEVVKLTVNKNKSTTCYTVTKNHIWYAKTDKEDVHREIPTCELKQGMCLRTDYTKAYRTYKPSPFGVAHGLFYGDGDHTGVHRRMNLCGDKMELSPYFMPDTYGVSNDVMTINAIPKIFWDKPSLDEIPAYLYGWLAGYFAADGSVDTSGNCIFTSSKRDDLEFVQDVLCVLGLPIYSIREQYRKSNLTGEYSTVYILTISHKHLNESFFIRSKHKERYLETVSKESREDTWKVKSIEETGEIIPVYCVVEEEHHSFALENGILTHNCYVLAPPEDSIEGIFDTASKMARTFSYGGGVGIDLSKLAPRGAKINNTAEQTSGAVSFTDLYSMVTGLIGQHGRRGALMLSMSCEHPDVEEFMRVKTDVNRVTKANMSIRVSDNFMECVEGEGTVIQTFVRPETGDSAVKSLDAKKFFDELCDANYDYGEPGILFWDRISDWNLLSEYDDFEYAGTNPCSELPLPAGGSCLLGSLNLAAFVEDGLFRADKLRVAVRTAVRALNDVLDEGQPLHPLEEQRQTVRDWRQIGLGIMGLADALIKLGVRYDSKEGRYIAHDIAREMLYVALDESNSLAKTDGAFPMCEPELITESPFFRQLEDELGRDLEFYELEHDINKHGLRNSNLLTIAPTGTLSTMLGISGGIEPIFATSYTRTTKSLEGWEKTYKVYTPIVKEYMERHGLKDESELPDYFVTAQDMDYHDRIDMQATWQMFIDASISSTVNIPEDFPRENVKDIYMYAWKQGCKGVTVFRDGCKRDSILTTKEAPERGVVEHVGDDVVGKKRKLMTGCGSLHCSAFFDPNTGKLKEVFLNKGSQGGCQACLNATSRLISLSLRSGCDTKDVVEQLMSVPACPSYAARRATKGDTSKGSSCAGAVANALEEMCGEVSVGHGQDANVSQKPKEPIRNVCPECGAELVYEGGCNSCKNCGWSRCG